MLPLVQIDATLSSSYKWHKNDEAGMCSYKVILIALTKLKLDKLNGAERIDIQQLRVSKTEVFLSMKGLSMAPSGP